MRLSERYSFFLSLGLAMSLRVAPFSQLISTINPDWVLLTVIYWTIMLPYRKGIFNAWVIGLLTDVLLGRTLGEYALIYAVIAYFCVLAHKRLRFAPLAQQSCFIFVGLLIAQLLLFLIENIQSLTVFPLVFWLPVLTGTVLWPLIHSILHFFCNTEQLTD